MMVYMSCGFLVFFFGFDSPLVDLIYGFNRIAADSNILYLFRPSVQQIFARQAMHSIIIVECSFVSGVEWMSDENYTECSHAPNIL